MNIDKINHLFHSGHGAKWREMERNERKMGRLRKNKESSSMYNTQHVYTVNDIISTSLTGQDTRLFRILSTTESLLTSDLSSIGPHPF